MAETRATDSTLSFLMNALGFRQEGVQRTSAGQRGLLGAERARLLPGVFGGQDIPDDQLAGLQDTFGDDFGRDDLAALSAGGSPIDTQFDRQARAIEVAREDQGLFRSGFTGQLLAENEAQRQQAQSDLISQFLAQEFNIFDTSQNALDEILLQQQEGQFNFDAREIQRQLDAEALGGGGGGTPVLDPFGGTGSPQRLLDELTNPAPTRPASGQTFGVPEFLGATQGRSLGEMMKIANERGHRVVSKGVPPRTDPNRSGNRGFPAGVM